MGNKFTERFGGGEAGVICPPDSPWLDINTFVGMEYAANLRGLEVSFGLAEYSYDPGTMTLVVGAFNTLSETSRIPLLADSVEVDADGVPLPIDLDARAQCAIETYADDILEQVDPMANSVLLGFGSRWGALPARLFAERIEDHGRRVLNFFDQGDADRWFNLPDWGGRKRSQKGVIIFE